MSVLIRTGLPWVRVRFRVGVGIGLGLGWGLWLGLRHALRHDALRRSVSNNFVQIRRIGIRRNGAEPAGWAGSIWLDWTRKTLLSTRKVIIFKPGSEEVAYKMICQWTRKPKECFKSTVAFPTRLRIEHHHNIGVGDAGEWWWDALTPKNSGKIFFEQIWRKIGAFLSSFHT